MTRNFDNYLDHYVPQRCAIKCGIIVCFVTEEVVVNNRSNVYKIVRKDVKYNGN